MPVNIVCGVYTVADSFLTWFQYGCCRRSYSCECDPVQPFLWLIHYLIVLCVSKYALVSSCWFRHWQTCARCLINFVCPTHLNPSLRKQPLGNSEQQAVPQGCFWSIWKHHSFVRYWIWTRIKSCGMSLNISSTLFTHVLNAWEL